MRSNAIIAAALLAGAADIVAADGTCNADNCLRAMRATQIPGRLESAKAFCATYTQATGTVAPTAIPSYAADGCKDNPNGPMAMRISSACSCIAPATQTTTAPGTPTTTPTGTATANPCAQISASWLEQKKTAPAASPTVAATLAHECLKSVPLGKDAALKLVDAIEPYLEWQSDAAYKKDPPKSYFYPGFDIFGNLAKVKSNLQSDKYSSEYEFQIDLYKQVWAPGQDGHYVFYPDLLTKALRWRRQVSALVSISEDGTSLPVIKLQKDVIANPKTAQAIAKINDIDAAKFIEDTVNSASFLQDVDSSYNTMFWSKSTAANGGVGNFVSGGRSSLFYPGPTTKVTFANGTTIELENKAVVVGDMTNVIDGSSMYKKFCAPGLLKAAAPAAAPAPAKPALPGYPVPVISTNDGVVSGYYLSGNGLDDVAVIVLTSFEPASPRQFQAVVSDFLREAKAAGKKKLVVDFQNNGGGYILLGYEFFRQLFPSVVQDGNSRWKQSKSFAAMSRVISDRVQDINPATESDEDIVSLYESWFNYKYDLNITNQDFATFEDKFAPQVYQDTDYTALMRWNLSDPLTTLNETFGMGMEISGYGSRANLSQYFNAEDIIMLYDGSCSSTCTLASEMLRLQGGVKSVAMGGRPKAGPIQGVGGIKGSQVLSFDNIYAYVNYVNQLTDDPKVKAELARFTQLPMQRSSASAVNVRDQILRDNVNDGVPAQFVAEDADCRLYWTAPMISDVTEVWKAAANSAFNGAKCAAGGIKGSSPHRRAAAPVAAAPRQPRLSEVVNTAPVKEMKHPDSWDAMHLQMAIN